MIDKVANYILNDFNQTLMHYLNPPQNRRQTRSLAL